MANIKSDNDGFLIGEPLNLNRTFELWSDIRNDMRAIRMALNGKGTSGLPIGKQAPNNRKSDNERMPQQPVAIPQRRDESTKSSAASTRNTISTPLKPAATPGNVRSTAKVNTNAERDTKTGRFTKNGSSSPLFGNESAGSSDRYVDSQPSSEDSTVRAAASKIADAVSSASSGMEETDPAIKAFSEVAQPMARGYEILTAGTGREQKDTFRWFRRIFGELKLFRRDETAFNKAANKSLKNIEETNPSASSSGDDSSWLRRYILPAAIAGLGALAASLPSGFMDKLAAAHGKAISAIKDTLFTSPLNHIVKNWDSIQAQMSSILEGVSSRIDSAWNAFTGFLKDKLGIDIPKVVAPAVDAGKKAIDTVKNSSVGKAISGAYTSAKDWVLGQTSKMFESGKGGAGTVSSGKGDFGGASYGTYQLSSKQGTLQKFLGSSKYGSQFNGLAPGSPEFNAKWKEIAQSDPEFGKSQHDFIKATHFDPQMQRLNKAGIDLSGRGAAVQDAVWSTAVQFGGNSSLIEKALAGKDASKLSDKDIVSAIQEYKIKNNDALFKSSSSDVRASTANRAVAEHNRLLSLADLVNIGNVQTAHAQVPESPRMPAPQLPADEPSIVEPLASTGSRNQNIIASAQPEVGQDVRDRRIAHIVTGGLSN